MKHYLMQILKKSLALAAGAMLATASMAQSQVVKQFPASLQWETMDLLAFNLNAPEFAGTTAQRELARSIWQPTIDAFPPGGPMGKWPAFILLKAFESPSHRYIFSAMSAAATAYSKCEDPINSKDLATPIYSLCPMRLVVQDKASGKSRQQEFGHYCTIFANDPDNPRSKNYQQVAVSQDGKTAYFRVVQYGKPAPECNRSIRLN